MRREFPTLTLFRGDGLPVVDRCAVADTPGRRLRGLLGRPALAAGEGMAIRPSWGIHTFFLRAPIDVIFVGPDQTVLRIVERLKPFRLVSCRGARDVVEACAGTCSERRLEEGNTVTWAAFRPGMNGAAAPPQWRPEPRVAANGGAPTGTVVLCSADRDFLRLARFLLEHHEIDVHVGRTDQTIALVEAKRPNVLVLDAGAHVVDAGRLLAAVDAQHEDVDVVVVGDEARTLSSFEIEDKWGVLEGLVERVGRAAAQVDQLRE